MSELWKRLKMAYHNLRIRMIRIQGNNLLNRGEPFSSEKLARLDQKLTQHWMSMVRICKSWKCCKTAGVIPLRDNPAV